MGLRTYTQKRDFTATSEPRGIKGRTAAGNFFCVQKHDATRLHYDFRLELDGALLSWAVTKGPSTDPADKRLAVRVEDHPIDYGNFEGTIPEGQYGGGTVMLWDRGRWEPEGDPHKDLRSGKLTFTLHGERLKGLWTLVRMHKKPGEKRENWLLIKDRDKQAKRDAKFLDKNTTSVKTGRTMDQIASGNSAVWESRKNAAPKKSANLNKSKKAPSLETLRKKYRAVQLATLVDAAPAGDDWVHEVKFDGYRLLGFVSNGDTRLYTRNGNDWTDRFPHIRDALAGLPCASAVIDMEAVMLDKDGKIDFQKLQNIISEEVKPEPIHAYAFDLLHLDGEDIGGEALLARKEKLKKLLEGSFIRYSEHIQGRGDEMVGSACKMGLEGIISKRADALYSPRRNRDWQKIKCVRRQEFVILGWTDSTAGKNVIGALHLGYYKGKALKYAGKVGTGYTHASARDLYKRLSAMKTVPAPDIIPREARRASHWVEPKQLCEVSFGMWTDDGYIRHASFHALRFDKSPRQVTQEMPEHQTQSKDNAVLGVAITHPDRVVFDPPGLKKIELAEYYGLAAPYILRDIGGHPLTLLRCPEGTEHECFYQRNPARGMGAHIKPFPWKHKGKPHTYFYIDDAQGIVELIQMGAIEIHAWGAHVKNIDFPDRIIFDCDPGPGVPFGAVKLAAQDLRRRLENLGLESFVKCTGGKGLHVRVPIAPKTPWADVKDFARRLCERMEEDTPEAYVTTMAKAKRKGKIFLDFFRNDYTATAVGDWTVRARDGAPVAVPIGWDELKRLAASSQFTIADAAKRLAKKPDDARYALKQALTKTILKSV